MLNILVTFLKSLFENWKVGVIVISVVAVVIIFGLLGTIYILTLKLDAQVAKVESLEKTVAIEKSNVEALTVRIGIQSSLHDSVDTLLKACYASRARENELNNTREEIMLNDTPIPIDQDQVVSGVKVVNRETRKRGMSLVNSLME
jgi:hypothetical protein